MGPVMPAARDNPNTRRLDVDVKPITVPFDLKCLLPPDWGLGGESGEAWFDPIRHGIAKQG